MSEDLDDGVGWICLETIEYDGDGYSAARRQFVDRHAELADKLDWVRIDLICGRGGKSALRFWVRSTPPPPQATRDLP